MQVSDQLVYAEGTGDGSWTKVGYQGTVLGSAEDALNRLEAAVGQRVVYQGTVLGSAEGTLNILATAVGQKRLLFMPARDLICCLNVDLSDVSVRAHNLISLTVQGKCSTTIRL